MGWVANSLLLQRFLNHAHGSVDKAGEMLTSTLLWRQRENVDDINLSACGDEGKTGKMYLSPRIKDLSGRPVLIMKPSRQNTTSHDDQVRFFIYCMERAMQVADDCGVGEIVWLMDYSDWQLKHNPPYRTSMELLSILQRHYPGLVGSYIVYKPPAYWRILWNSLAPFIDHDVSLRVAFISRTPGVKGGNTMDLYFNTDDLYDYLDGTRSDSWTYDTWKGDMKALEDRCRFAYITRGAELLHVGLAKTDRPAKLSAVLSRVSGTNLLGRASVGGMSDDGLQQVRSSGSGIAQGARPAPKKFPSRITTPPPHEGKQVKLVSSGPPPECPTINTAPASVPVSRGSAHPLRKSGLAARQRRPGLLRRLFCSCGGGGGGGGSGKTPRTVPKTPREPSSRITPLPSVGRPSLGGAKVPVPVR